MRSKIFSERGNDPRKRRWATRVIDYSDDLLAPESPAGPGFPVTLPRRPSRPGSTYHAGTVWDRSPLRQWGSPRFRGRRRHRSKGDRIFCRRKTPSETQRVQMAPRPVGGVLTERNLPDERRLSRGGKRSGPSSN